MEQFSATCPHCNFVLQFYDESLFGRKGRCPRCRNKFVLNLPEPEKPKSHKAKPKAEPPETKPQPAGEIVPSAKAAPPPTPAPAPPAVAAPAATPGEKDQPWEMEMSRGLAARRSTLAARWVLPNVLSPLCLLAMAGGAATGMGAAALLLKDASGAMLTGAAACGGAVALAFLIRRYDPLK